MWRRQKGKTFWNRKGAPGMQPSLPLNPLDEAEANGETPCPPPVARIDPRIKLTRQQDDE